ncbi:MAG: tRNA (N6-threonylcarbamoyladenosine(37)-N6)-methyltransferase TrmO, partial [Prevotella sp.]|nr:tRNA (N6-threonylcarbamoyladenosine(37)-N6)-methyltransferase TrmO [Prevotella sp.]
DTKEWHPLEVVIPQDLSALMTENQANSLRGILAQDPRPQYHDDPNRLYGLPFADWDVKFRVKDGVLTVVSFD